MAPLAFSSAVQEPLFEDLPLSIGVGSFEKNYNLDRNLLIQPIAILNAKGNIIYSKSGREILDGSGGPSVNSIGHDHPAPLKAMHIQMSQLTYCNSALFTVAAVGDAAKEVAELSGFAKAYFCSSGNCYHESLIYEY
jgi:acetylornithine/succinyldiaminopimelate/putrescine aminotransferase